MSPIEVKIDRLSKQEVSIRGKHQANIKTEMSQMEVKIEPLLKPKICPLRVNIGRLYVI